MSIRITLSKTPTHRPADGFIRPKVLYFRPLNLSKSKATRRKPSSRLSNSRRQNHRRLVYNEGAMKSETKDTSATNTFAVVMCAALVAGIAGDGAAAELPANRFVKVADNEIGGHFFSQVVYAPADKSLHPTIRYYLPRQLSDGAKIHPLSNPGMRRGIARTLPAKTRCPVRSITGTNPLRSGVHKQGELSRCGAGPCETVFGVCCVPSSMPRDAPHNPSNSFPTF